MGGFGGAEGLANFLRDNGIALVVDATHPFATQISANAYAAAKNTGSERVALVRPPWVKKSEPDWFDTDSLESAARIPPTGSTVFLALGSQHLEPFVFRKDVNFIVRMVDEPEIPPFPNCRVVTGMPGETIAEERALLKRESVDHLICRNSGGDAGFAKIEAAWQLGIPVLMIERPPPPAEPVLKTVDDVVDFIERGFGAYPS